MENKSNDELKTIGIVKAIRLITNSH